MASIPTTWIVGQRVSVESDFRLGGVLTDPVTVTAFVRAPGGTLTTYTYPTTGLTRDTVGVYRLEFTASAAGSWAVRFEGTGGGVEAVGETVISVNPSQVV